MSNRRLIWGSSLKKIKIEKTKMREAFILFNLILLITLKGYSQNKNPKTTVIQKPEFGKILDSLKVKGSILIFDVKNMTYYSNDFSWAKTGIIPASTFKIPNSIIALETGIIQSDSTIFKWNGEKRRFKKWEEDLTFKKGISSFLCSLLSGNCQKSWCEKNEIVLEKTGLYWNGFRYFNY